MCLHEAVKRGYDNISLECHEKNKKGLALYERFNFVKKSQNNNLLLFEKKLKNNEGN